MIWQSAMLKYEPLKKINDTKLKQLTHIFLLIWMKLKNTARVLEPDRKEPFGWAVPAAKWIYKDTFMLYGMPMRDVQAQLAGKRGRKRRKGKAPDVDSLEGDTVIVYDQRIEIPPEQLKTCNLVVIIQNGRIQTWHEL